MDIEMPDIQQKAFGVASSLSSSSSSSASCSICLELVLDRAGRSTAKLHCGHEFHLDCIGSAFNAKGAMQCPNCRKIEKGRWLYANGQRSSADIDIDGWMTEDFYDLISYPESPFALQWCPFRGFTQLATFLHGKSHSHCELGQSDEVASYTCYPLKRHLFYMMCRAVLATSIGCCSLAERVTFACGLALAAATVSEAGLEGAGAGLRMQVWACGMDTGGGR